MHMNAYCTFGYGAVYMWLYLEEVLLPALGPHRARDIVRRSPRLQHFGVTGSGVAWQMVVHLPRPYEINPVDQLRADGAALPAKQSDVGGATLEGGAHILDGKGTHPQDHLYVRSKYSAYRN